MTDGGRERQRNKLQTNCLEEEYSTAAPSVDYLPWISRDPGNPEHVRIDGSNGGGGEVNEGERAGARMRGSGCG